MDIKEIRETLELTNGNREAAAEVLGITQEEIQSALTADERAAQQSGPESAIPTASNLPLSTAPDYSEQKEDGRKAASEIEDARSKSDAVARTLLTEKGFSLAILPVAAADAFLGGFEEGLIAAKLEKKVAQTRKYEAKRVLSAARKVAVENLEEARAKMLGWQVGDGGYHAFVNFCRNLAPSGSPRGRPTTPRTKLGARDEVRSKELLRGMNQSQAMDAAVIVAANVAANGDIASVRVIANVYLQPLMLSKDAGIQKWAQDSHERAMQILAASDKAEQHKKQEKETGAIAKSGAEAQPVANIEVPVAAVEQVQQVVNG